MSTATSSEGGKAAVHVEAEYASTVEDSQDELIHPSPPLAGEGQMEEHELEPDQKRRRVSASDQDREKRMARYAKERIKEIDSSKPHNTKGHRARPYTPSSRDPSVSRSEDQSVSKSPAPSQQLPARIGKRVRRRPQRWEGERIEMRSIRGGRPPTRGRDSEPAILREIEDASTASIHSVDSTQPTPLVDNPFVDLDKAIGSSSGESSRRDVVDSFHSWQLRAVSKQAAQLKALHVYLKRRLRKRTTRSPEYDRMEDEALRNARNAAIKLVGAEGANDSGAKEYLSFPGGTVVPSKLRLPLEAYLPRRIRAGRRVDTAEDILQRLPLHPQLSVSYEDEVSGDQTWIPLPTVSMASIIAEHNEYKQNSSNMRNMREVKVEMHEESSDND